MSFTRLGSRKRHFWRAMPRPKPDTDLGSPLVTSALRSAPLDQIPTSAKVALGGVAGLLAVAAVVAHSPAAHESETDSRYLQQQQH